MNLAKFENALKIGETAAIEFKRAGGTIEMDTFETVCSFSNRFGGDIYLGVLDNGIVVGVPENAAQPMVKNFISAIGNPDLFSPTLYLEPEIFKYRKKTLIHIHVPSSGEVHSFKKRIYDRVDEADVKVSATAKIAQMYIRKQEIYTERRVYPYVKLKDLRLDLLPMIRILAKNNAGGSHLWEKLSNRDLLKSAGLYAEDHVTGKNGFNLAAVMLLGRDEVIRDICPAYQTDALVRKVNVDRYDDRLTVVTNLVESFEQLFKFATLHLPDKFYVEGAERKSLRNIVAREMLVNTLMHREYSSSYQAKFVIEQDRMYVENANRARFNGPITLRNLEPFPKNPLIASFFRNIGYSEKLGSGARKMFKYGRLYSGVEPEFFEDDVFRIIQPLNENYSFDAELTNGVGGQKGGQKSGQKGGQKGGQNEDLELDSTEFILEQIARNPHITRRELSKSVGMAPSAVQKHIEKLKSSGRISRIGGDRGGHWEVHDK